MSDALLEFECRVPAGGYRIMSFDERKFVEIAAKFDPRSDDYSVLPPPDATDDERHLLRRWGMRIVPDVSKELIDIGIEPEVREILEPQSEKYRCFDLFEEAPSPYLEFVNAPANPLTPLYEAEPAKTLADRFGPLHGEGPQYADQWYISIMEMRQAVTKWERAKTTGDFRPIVRFVSRHGVTRRKFGRFFESDVGRIDTNILLRDDPLSGAARLCIRPSTLLNALWTQLAQAIDGSESLRTCVECKKWFTIKSGEGRSDKEYCSNACRMRAYRKRKGDGAKR